MNWRMKLTIFLTMLVTWGALAAWPVDSLAPPALAEVSKAPWALRTFLFHPAILLGTLVPPLAWFASVAYGSYRLFNALFNAKGPQ